jgi:arginase family enzyme
MNALDELAALLRPAGGGIFLFSTGKAAQEEVQRKLYGVATAAEVQAAFRKNLEAIATARGVLLGIPSDVGAGYRRGASFGPQAIRAQLLAQGDWAKACAGWGLVDVGDVFVVPQLQHDDMLSPTQLAASRAALYPSLDPADAAHLPVSPLSIAERAWDLIFSLNPKVKPFALGGDHSTALPGVLALKRARPEVLGIVQPDAHTDLLETRLGVKYCFATWSWHANEVYGRQGRMVQLGIRATGRTQEHWETTLGVRQFWAHAVLADPKGAMDQVIAHLRAAGVKGVYFSNDIDGTDASYGDATGTPEAQGLEPEWLVELIRRLGREVGLVGGDVMEVAPPLGSKPGETEKTVALAARYFRETVQAAFAGLGSPA